VTSPRGDLLVSFLGVHRWKVGGGDMMRGKYANEVILVVLGIVQGRVVSVVLFCWVLNGRDTISN
jgi:hypothetical protein